MLNYLWASVDLVIRTFNQFDRQQWLCVFAVVLVVGLFCLRGTNLRSPY